MFNKIKNEIINIVNSKKYLEVTRDTYFDSAGIYLIYIDNFSDEKVLPIYIGQTNNFQKRHKQHLSEILSLNRLKYDLYKEYFKYDIYNGNYKACKMFKYMIEHNCTIKDFHMIILEMVDEPTQELLEKKEKDYFDKFLPAFIGFNQYNYIYNLGLLHKEELHNTEHKLSDKEYFTDLLKDTRYLLKLFEYGYNNFNYNLAFPKNTTFVNTGLSNEEELELNNNINELSKKYYDSDKAKEYEKKEAEVSNIWEEISITNQKCEEIYIKLKTIFKNDVTEYCIKNKINKDNINRIYYLLCYNKNDEPNYYEDQKNRFQKYLKRRKITENIIDIIDCNNKIIKKYKEDLSKERIKYNELINKKDNYSWGRIRDNLIKIFPNKEYTLFPLKDNYAISQTQNSFNNTILINMIYNNNNRTYSHMIDLLLINYSVRTDTIIKQDSILIKNNWGNCYNDELCYYYDKRENNPFTDPFQITSTGLTYISINVEYKYGINDYTIENNRTLSLNDAMKEIENEVKDIQLKYVIHTNNKLKAIEDINILEIRKDIKEKMFKAIKSHK